MMEYSKEDIVIIERLLTLKKALRKDVDDIKYIINKYIDPKATICYKCSGQIRFAHARVKVWYEKNKQEFTMHRCKSCGIPLQDKRKKLCDNCKKQ